MNAEQLAKRFHELYEEMAPSYGWVTKKESQVPWENLPKNNKKLMIEVCGHIITEIKFNSNN